MSPDIILNMTGMLICYHTWDELDAVHSRLSQMQLPGSTTLLKAFNPVENIPYPFTLALITKDKADLDALDDYLTDNNVDLGTDKDMYAGEPRVREFLRMFLIDKYPPGFLKIRYGRCPLHAVSEGACMFCSYGHATECHYPQTCEEAKCSHLDAKDTESGYSEFDRLILEKGTCCICGQPLKTSKYVNMGMLNKKAAWKDPSWGNVLVEGSGGRAVFFVCDRCQEAGEKGEDPGPVKYAVEVKDGEFILHNIEELEDVPPITPEMAGI